MIRRLAFTVMISLAALRGGYAQPMEMPAGVPTAESLLQGCIAALPDIQLRILGLLQSRNSEGDVEAKVNVEMLLDWRADPPTARYTTRDAFGKASEHLSITWTDPSQPEYRFFRGDPLVAADLPPLADPIAATDLTWMDLSLSFLWWPDGKVVGAEEVKGRACYIVDLPAPTNTFQGIIGVRLWIDPKIPVLLRAESYGLDEKPLRRMEVKSFRKINDRWFLQNIEFTTIPTKHRTVLKVTDVMDKERKSFLKDDAGPDGPATPEPADESVAPVEPIPVSN